MALSKLAVRRLTKLADHMDALPPEARKHFHMGDWVSHEGKDDHGLSRKASLSKRDLFTCGTTACALGHAATIPPFRRAGLRADYHHGSGDVLFNDEWGPYAASVFFDIGYMNSCHLFADEATITTVKTPKQWAKHCRKFLRAQGMTRMRAPMGRG